MITYIFRNPDNSLYVEFITDANKRHERFTIMQINGLSFEESLVGLNFREVDSIEKAFSDFAVSKNLILEARKNVGPVETIVAEGDLTEFAFVTETLPNGGASDASEITRVTFLAEGSVKENNRVVCVADTAGSLNSKYFLISSTEEDYYVWLNVNSAGIDPEISNRIGIEVEIATDATDAQVATAIKLALTATDEFVTSGTGATLDALNTVYGNTQNIAAGDSGFTCTTNIDGVDSVINNKYFTFNTAEENYYVWYNVSTDGTDPEVAEKVGVEVAISREATAAQVATATRTAIHNLGLNLVIPVPNSNYIDIQNTDLENIVDATAGDSGFTISVTNQGEESEFYSEQIEVEGSIGQNLVFTITDGELPTGLSLIRNSGFITGTPSVAGEYTFEVSATDSFQTISQEFSIEIEG